jgi:dihydropteroate synthase
MASSSLFPKKSFLNIRGELYILDTPKVMGILNITPDSFYDGGKYTSEKDQLIRVEKMLNEGADFIDIGAQSSRPGAQEIGAEKEIAMLGPAVESIRKHFPDATISIDTWHAKVAKSAYNFGADIINDISGGTFDKEMFNAILELQIPYILMHTGDRPEVMQNNPHYENVLKEVIYFMSKQIAELNLLGVNDIIIDPGFGFGKTLEHNYELLKNLNHFSFLEAPILVGISRKSMIYKYLNIKPDDSLNSTTALNMIALKNGADILRVHDVKEAKECIELWKLLN